MTNTRILTYFIMGMNVRNNYGLPLNKAVKETKTRILWRQMNGAILKTRKPEGQDADLVFVAHFKAN